MSIPDGLAAPASGLSLNPGPVPHADQEGSPSLEALAADPEIAALLEFEPVPRKRSVDSGWTPELQREFMIRLASHGSPGRACEDMGKALTGMTKVYRSPLAASFRAAWKAAVALARQRANDRVAKAYVEPGTRAPTIDHRRKHPGAAAAADEPLPGQVRNERGEWEDPASIDARVADVRLRWTQRLLDARRLYLSEIADSPGKRAAFEILTRLPIDARQRPAVSLTGRAVWQAARTATGGRLEGRT
jgi:hypothetical protein